MVVKNLYSDVVTYVDSILTRLSTMLFTMLYTWMSFQCEYCLAREWPLGKPTVLLVSNHLYLLSCTNNQYQNYT